MANKNQAHLENEQSVGQAVSGVEIFLKKNGKVILCATAAAVVAVAAFFAVNVWIVQPKVEEAKGQAFVAEQHFAAGEFDLALNGDGNALGFADVIAQYGNKAGKAVYLYAGICNLQLKEYAQAVEMLKKYNGKDVILKARATSCIGDAYVGLGDLNGALNYYEKAISMADNIYAAQYMMKAAITAEELGQTDKALKLYEQIKVKYPQSFEGYDVDKYIYRIKK